MWIFFLVILMVLDLLLTLNNILSLLLILSYLLYFYTSHHVVFLIFPWTPLGQDGVWLRVCYRSSSSHVIDNGLGRHQSHSHRYFYGTFTIRYIQKSGSHKGILVPFQQYTLRNTFSFYHKGSFYGQWAPLSCLILGNCICG